MITTTTQVDKVIVERMFAEHKEKHKNKVQICKNQLDNGMAAVEFGGHDIDLTAHAIEKGYDLKIIQDTHDNGLWDIKTDITSVFTKRSV